MGERLNWRSVLKELVPPLLLRAFRHARFRLLPGTLRYFCPVCRKRVDAFIPLAPYYDEQAQKYGYVHSPYLTETINRRQYECPRCGATDRDRL